MRLAKRRRVHPGDPMAVVSRFLDAANHHDIDALYASVHPEFESFQPLHPVRNFRGPGQLISNWKAIFKAEPGFRLTVLRASTTGNTVWVELHGAGDSAEAAGIFIMGVENGRIRWVRVYSDLVEPEPEEEVATEAPAAQAVAEAERVAEAEPVAVAEAAVAQAEPVAEAAGAEAEPVADGDAEAHDVEIPVTEAPAAEAELQPEPAVAAAGDDSGVGIEAAAEPAAEVSPAPGAAPWLVETPDAEATTADGDALAPEPGMRLVTPAPLPADPEPDAPTEAATPDSGIDPATIETLVGPPQVDAADEAADDTPAAKVIETAETMAGTEATESGADTGTEAAPPVVDEAPSSPEADPVEANGSDKQSPDSEPAWARLRKVLRKH